MFLAFSPVVVNEISWSMWLSNEFLWPRGVLEFLFISWVDVSATSTAFIEEGPYSIIGFLKACIHLYIVAVHYYSDQDHKEVGCDEVRFARAKLDFYLMSWLGSLITASNS